MFLWLIAGFFVQIKVEAVPKCNFYCWQSEDSSNGGSEPRNQDQTLDSFEEWYLRPLSPQDRIAAAQVR